MKKNFLDTGIKLVKNVNRYNFGKGSIAELNPLLEKKRELARESGQSDNVIYFIDNFFEQNINLLYKIKFYKRDKIYFVNTDYEPNTENIDKIKLDIKNSMFENPCAIVGIGGGITLDTSKAVSNLLNNDGLAESYQGWDLLKNKGVFKIGIPTISGTGAESTRTCVLTNIKSGLKLGMNSDFTVFDHLIMDPDLTVTVPRDQYFYTGMDSYIHCFESLNGIYRNAIGDAYSRECMRLAKEVFESNEMMSSTNREKLMVASYLGGCAIASSYVGIVHPFSAGLSVVLGLHHCIANCIVMYAMEEFYPRVFEEFWNMVRLQNIEIPRNICKDLTNLQYDALYAATIIHEKPLTNALGNNFKEKLDKRKVIELFKMM